MIGIKFDNLEIELTSNNMGLISLISIICDDVKKVYNNKHEGELLEYLYNKYSPTLINSLALSSINPVHCNNILRGIIDNI